MRSAAVILLVVITTLSSSRSFACRCVEPPVSDAYRRVDVVVIATIEAVERTGEDLKAKITVDKAWKASVPSAVTFVSGESCAYEVQPGQKHLLFLYKGADGVYGTVRCRGSRALAEAKSSVAWLTKHGQVAQLEPSKPCEAPPEPPPR